MITEKQVLLAKAGTNWTQSNKANKCWLSLCTTQTGRIIAASDAGIWYSDDNGVNWAQSNKTSGEWYCLCVIPTGRIIAGRYANYIYYSDDNGDTWTQSQSESKNWWFLCVTPTGRIVATSDGYIYYSDDNGDTWTQSQSESKNWYCLCVISTGRIIAGSDTGIWYSDNNGVNWAQSNQDLDPWNRLCVTSTGRIIAGSTGTGIWYSDNNGISWTASDKYTGTFNVLCVELTGRIIAGSTDAGIWYSDNNGVNWVQSNKANKIWNSLCVTSTGRIIAGSSSIGTGIWYSDPVTAGAGRLWKNSGYDFGIKTLIVTPTGRTIVFDGGKMVKYSDDCKTFTNSQLDSNVADAYGVGVGRAACVTLTGRLIAGTSGYTSGIVYSDDNGETWTHKQIQNIMNVEEFGTLSTGRIFACCYRGIRYSDDNGETWTQATDITNNNQGHGSPSGGPVTCYSMCITSTGRIIAGTAVGIYYSDDSGETWTSVYIDAGEGNIDGVNKILLSGNRLFLGCDYGVYYSDDNGETWTRVTDIVDSHRWQGACYSICITPAGRIITVNVSSIGIWYSDNNGTNWVQSNATTNYSCDSLCVMPTGRVIASNDYNSLCSDPETISNYTVKPITGKQAKELVQQCKAYVQSLKNGN